MDIRSKAAIVVLAMAIVSFPGFSRASQEDPPPEQSQGPGAFGPRGPMRQMQGGEPQGQMGRMGMHRMGMGGMGMQGRPMGGRGFGLGRLLNNPTVRQQLGITAAQAAKIRQEESEFRKTNIRNRADLEIKRIDLNDLLSADQPDRSAIDSKLQEISAAQLVLEKSAVDFRLTMRDALTPAQRQKLQQMMMQRGRPGLKAGPDGPPGGGRRGGRGPARPPNAQGEAPPNQ